MLSFVAVIVGFVTACWWYYRVNFNLWKKQNVPGPFPLPFVGTAYRLFTTPMIDVDTENFKKYGNIFGEYGGTTPILMVNDPEITKVVTIKDSHIFPDREKVVAHDAISKKVLTTLSGEEWKKARKVVTPVFTSGKLKRMYPIIQRCAEEALEAFREQQELQDIEIKEFWGYYTLNVIAKSCFATDLNAFKNREGEFVKHVRALFGPLQRNILFRFLPKRLVKTLGMDNDTASAGLFFMNITDHLLKKRMEDQQWPDDFLRLLMDAKNETRKGSDSASIEELVDDNFIKAQAITFFAAGFETTATLLGFASYCLALNPDVQEKLHQALMEIKQPGGSIRYEDLSGCKYLDAFISEALRRYPPAVRLARVAEEECTVSGTGITIPKGSMVSCSIYCMHHNPDYFPEPYDFKPERFLPKNAHLLVPHTFLPFGSGPRSCIAMRFALLEAKLAIARTVLEYRFVRTPNTKDALEFANVLGLLTPKSVIVGVEKRI